MTPLVLSALLSCTVPSAASPALGTGVPSTELLDEAPQPFVAPASATVRQLSTAYMQEYRSEHRMGLLDLLGRTAPASTEDLRWLLNLYERGDPLARRRAEESLLLISPARQDLAPFLVSLLEEEEDPSFHAFAISGLARLRHAPSLERIRRIASRTFPQREPTLAMAPTDAARWTAQFQALQALAYWEGKQALPLLCKKAEEAPRVAAIASAILWEHAAPEILRWSESRLEKDQERARAAWAAPVDLRQTKATLPLLKAAMLDRKKKLETRRQAAVRVGIASSEAEIDELLKLHDAAKDKNERLILSAALFASGNKKAAPLLIEHVKTNPSAPGRAGALFQLRDMLGREEYLDVLKWVAEHDKDPENRDSALRELAEPK